MSKILSASPVAAPSPASAPAWGEPMQDQHR
jgi:hypothetical protein